MTKRIVINQEDSLIPNVIDKSKYRPCLGPGSDRNDSGCSGKVFGPADKRICSACKVLQLTVQHRHQ